MIKYVLSVILLVAMHGTAFSQGNEDPLRYNGDNWIRFGPAVINSCRSIRLYLEGGENNNIRRIVFISDPVKVESIKKWLTDNFESILNSSPVSPIYEAVGFGNVIILYSSEEEKNEDRLLTIPMTHFTYGCYGSKCRKRPKGSNAFKELMELTNN